MRGLLLLGSSLVVLMGAGCAQKENTQSSSTKPSATSTETVPPAADEPGSATEQVDASGSIADIMGRVHEQERQLDQIIAGAQLSEVHKKAFAIRDLIEAAAAKSPDSEKAKLQPHVEAVRAIAGELDASGDSGDLGTTKSGYQKLQTHLRAIEGALGVAAR